jgi:hypothetical protein
MTAQVIGQINQQQVDLYREITTDYTPDEVKQERQEKKEQQKEREKGILKRDAEYTQHIRRKEVMDMESKMTPSELMEFLMKTAEDMKRMKESPPQTPTPPTDPSTPMPPSKDMETLNKLKQMSATIAEHLKVQVDIHKYAAAAIHETHKLSFDLYKDIDAYMKSP